VLFAEPSASKITSIINKYERKVSHHLIESELFSVFNRQKIELSLALDILDTIEIVYPNNPLREEAIEIAGKYQYLRGADLLHVACAKWISCNNPSSIAFISLDVKQYEVAKSIGFECNM
jgi:predicted nucleic acid-binding protein